VYNCSYYETLQKRLSSQIELRGTYQLCLVLFMKLISWFLFLNFIRILRNILDQI